MIPTFRLRLIPRYRRRVAVWIIAGLGMMAAPWSLADSSPWFPDVLPGSACQVNSVHDADTLRATCNGEKVKIRLYCIDAPELAAQRPWGQESRDYLRRIIPQQISIRQHDRDRYGRLVAEVFGHAGKNLNLALVEAGQAAVYPRYCRDSPYFDAQAQAKADQGAEVDFRESCRADWAAEKWRIWSVQIHGRGHRSPPLRSTPVRHPFDRWRQDRG